MPPTATAKRVKRSSKSPAAGALHGTGPGGVALQGPGPGGPLSTTTTVQTVESAVMEDNPSVVRSVLRANHHMMKCMQVAAVCPSGKEITQVQDGDSNQNFVP